MLKTALFAGVAGLLLSGSTAYAGPKYDVKIEHAAKKMVARKIGDIRGSMDTQMGFTAAEAEPVVIAQADPNSGATAVRFEFTGPLIASNQSYHSGRPEPLRKVRMISSFVYY